MSFFKSITPKIILSLMMFPAFSQAMENTANKNGDKQDKKSWAHVVYNHPYATSLLGFGIYNAFLKKPTKAKLIEAELSPEHQILGVSKNATNEEIKKAYYKKAKEFHPDRNPGNKFAAEKMKELNAAYKTLLGEVSSVFKSTDSHGFKDIKNEFVQEASPLFKQYRYPRLAFWAGIGLIGGSMVAKPSAKLMISGLTLKYLSHYILMQNNEAHTHKGLLFNYKFLEKSDCKKK